MKQLTLAVIAGFILFSCGQKKQEQEEVEVKNYEIKELLSNPLDYEEQIVAISGVISHVCRHSGDKMRVAELEGEGLSILVMLGDHNMKLAPESEGREVSATGVMKVRIRNLDELEEEHDHDHGDDHDHDHVCESTEAAIKLMKEKGIDPDILAYIELISFELK